MGNGFPNTYSSVHTFLTYCKGFIISNRDINKEQGEEEEYLKFVSRWPKKLIKYMTGAQQQELRTTIIDKININVRRC